MDLRIDETVTGLCLGMGDLLAFGSRTKARTIQSIGDLVLGGIFAPPPDGGEWC